MKYEACPSCNGSGQYWGGEDIFVCWECKGNSVVKKEISDLIILGRKIGTFTGWDEIGDINSMTLYDPVIEGMPDGAQMIHIFYDAGIYQYEGEGECMEIGDILELVNGFPICKETKEKLSVAYWM